MKRTYILILTLVQFLSLASASGQEAPGSTGYHNEVDSLLTIRRISILPFLDNTDGIYARPLEAQVVEQIQKDHHWDYIAATSVGPVLSPDDLEENPDKLTSVISGLDVDALIAGRIAKGPSGITIKMDLFLSKDKKLISQVELKGHPKFGIEELRQKVSLLLTELLKKIPYDGLVLSRQGTRVTLNLGKKDGVQPDQVVSVIHIIKLIRHPKFSFLVNTEKEVLGRVKLVKVDDTLSFGVILTEKEKGVIVKNSKISGLDFVKYGDTSALSWSNAPEDSLEVRPDSEITFGKNPSPWVPQKPPTFGQVGGTVGVGSFWTTKRDVSPDPVTYDADVNMYPRVSLEIELWMTPLLSLHGRMRQGILEISNPKGASPRRLQQNLNAYDLLLGYNFRGGPSVWGPQVELLAGYSDYEMTTDAGGAFTSLNYSGLKFGLRGLYPVSKDSTWIATGFVDLLFQPTLEEKPASSGTSKNTINVMGLGVAKRITNNLKAVIGAEWALYSTKFTGGSGATVSQKHTSLDVGAYYMF